MFHKTIVGDTLYSIIYGQGRVITALPAERRDHDSYTFEVEYMNGIKVVYIDNGVANWSSKDGCTQTIFHRKDIDLSSENFLASCDELLSKKKVLKYMDRGEH